MENMPADWFRQYLPSDWLREKVGSFAPVKEIGWEDLCRNELYCGTLNPAHPAVYV